MYSNFSYRPYGYEDALYPIQNNQYLYQPYFYQDMSPYYSTRQQHITGQATWTEGGSITKCGIPWSHNHFMTVAVGAHAPYHCGQTLKIRNLSVPGSKEILVTVVDQVEGYPANKINLHRKAFEALGATLDMGVINVEIIPSPGAQQDKWGSYLMTVTQAAYPGYQVSDYKFIKRSELSHDQTKETYEFILHSHQGQLRVRGYVIYNPTTGRLLTLNLREMQE